MSLLPGYRVSEAIFEGEQSIVYRATRESDGLVVALKLLNQSYPTPERIERFDHEFRVARILGDRATSSRRSIGTRLDDRKPQHMAVNSGLDEPTVYSDSHAAKPIHGDIVRAFDLVEHQRRRFIVMEYCLGSSLSALLGDPLPLHEVLGIAIQIAGLLGRIHEAGVVHKDINPSNLIYDRDSGQLRLIDFGISSLVAREATAFYGLSIGLGTPAYLSPEQTGRTNRSIDYRSDFYSFGVTLYQLLTGSLPFQGADLMELVHCHIARHPEPPHILAPSVPLPVSQIVLKLMEKNAERRFQSAQFLRVELQRRLDSVRQVPSAPTSSVIPPDVSSQLRIPEKLFGRERELSQLQAAFARVRTGATCVMLISGAAGVGKTKLAKELHRPITAQYGNFVEGKFERLKRDVPYAAFIQAFRQLVNHLLTESEATLNAWRRRVLDAIQPNAGLVIGLIPEFSLILGAQPPVPELSPTEARNRIKIVFRNLIGAFATRETPLVMFLDDLQWADGATFELIESLIALGQSHHLLLVGAQRDGEVGSDQRLTRMLEDAQTSGTFVERIELSPLDLRDVTQLVAEALCLKQGEAASIAKLLYQKTGGNPFFVGEYLRLLNDEGLLRFDARVGWIWRPSSDGLRNISDSIADLVKQRIEKITPRAQELIHLAACVGGRFGSGLLAVLQDVPLAQVKRDIQEALTEELVQRVAAVVTTEQGSENSGNSLGEYRFVHDHVQAAAYELAAPAQRLERHRQIGRVLLREGETGPVGDKLFNSLHHLNLCGPSGMNAEERHAVAEQNLRAARAARGAAAFEQCLNYARAGIEFLHAAERPLTRGGETHAVSAGAEVGRTTPWSTRYELTYSLFLEAARAAYLNLDFELMDGLVTEILANSRGVLDRVAAHEIRSMSLISRGQLNDGIRVGLMALGLLGVHFPEHPGKRHVALSYARTRLALLGRSPAALRAMAPIQSARLLAVFRILKEIAAAVYLARPDLFPLTVLKQVQLSARHGNTAESAMAYCTFALVLGGVMGNFRLGTQFGQLALGVLEDFESRELYPRVHFLNNYFIRPWKEPFADVLRSMLDTYQAAIRTGDFEYGAYALDLHLACAYHSGGELGELDNLAAGYTKTIGELGQERTLQIVKMRWQAIRSLMEPGVEPWRMVGAVCDCEKLQATMESAGDTHGVRDLLVNRLIVCYHFYRYDDAFACLHGIEKGFDALAGEVLMPLYYFYCSLVHFARISALTPVEKRQSIRRIRHCRRQLGKWADSAPANYAHKRVLLDALWAEYEGKLGQARELYDRAVDTADKNGYVHELALASELSGAFYLRMGRENVASHYLRDAQYWYELWGARARTEALVAKYPELAVQRTRGVGSMAPSTRTSQAEVSLDSISVVKSSQAISGEIQLNELLAKLMRIVLENAGAQRGVLLLPKAGDWTIEVEGSAEHWDAEAMSSVPLNSRVAPLRVPGSLVRYVIRTKSEVVVDSSQSAQFSADPYVVKHRPESMLGLPFIRQGTLAGVLYLENKAISHVFTPERLELLKVLSAQAAISIENARLFAEMRSLTEAQKRFVPYQFLEIMDRRDIAEVDVGDYVARSMSVLFCDLRQFTPLTERLPPKATIELLNQYYGAMEPPIREHGGFIDAFTGDEIMVLFDGTPDAAVSAAISMFGALEELNRDLSARHDIQLDMGVGINTGDLLLGTVGGKERIKCGVVGDTVNVASRIEALTRHYNAKILIGETTYDSLVRPEMFQIRPLEKVRARGKSKEVGIFEVMLSDTG